MKTNLRNVSLLATALGALTITTASAVSFQGLGLLDQLPSARTYQGKKYPAGYSFNRVGAVSADGGTAVGVAFTMVEDELMEVPYTWTRADGLVGFGTPAPFGSRKLGVCDVSADGSVLVGYSPFGSAEHAAAWSRQGELLWMETNTVYSAAYGVSADGHKVFGYFYTRPVSMPWRWENGIGSNLYDAATLPLGEGFKGGRAYAASADGSVVAGIGIFTGTNFPSVPSNSGTNLAFRWDAANGLVPLPSLPRHRVGYVYGISAD